MVLTDLIVIDMAWLIPLLIWTIFWKGLGLWKAGNHKQKYWFIAILVLSTAGILPIVYLLFFQQKGAWLKTKKKRK